MTDAYERLAKYLDTLPASYPPAPDGVELRLLEHLFTPQEAKLALQSPSHSWSAKKDRTGI